MDGTDRIKSALNDARILGLTSADNDALGELFTEFFSNGSSDSESENDSDPSDHGGRSSDESASDGGREIENEPEEPMIIDSPDDDAEESNDDEEQFVEGDNDEAANIVQAVGTDGWVLPDAEDELQKIQSFTQCRCRGQRCLEKFDNCFIIKLRCQMSDAALTKSEKKMFLLGKISATLHNTETTTCKKRASQKQRQKSRMQYLVDGIKVCRETFLFMHNISNNLLSSLIKHYKEEGAVPPKMRSGGRKVNRAALSVKDIERVVQFITSYAKEHALVIPGRVSGVKCQDPRVRLLPSSVTKSSLWRQYTTSMSDINSTRTRSGDPEFHSVKRVSFSKLWREYCPFVLPTKPKTDLCWVCQRNNSSVYQSANQLVAKKLAKLKHQEEHLRVVNMERDLYRSMVKACKESVGGLHLGQNQPASRQMTCHYSFDFAQQVHYPHNPNQPGPMYFLCPRKCGIFGVCCEGIPQQVNFLVDEGMASSKGSNAVLSYLHHFFSNFGLGEVDVVLHCDNCSGQNKNNFVMWYMAWRVLQGLHHNISINFLIAGHTKFSPDWCFGLLKQRFRRCVVSSLADLEEVVRTSTTSGVNIPQLIGTEDGTSFVPMYDWQTYLKPFFKTLPGIKSYQHIRFSKSDPGTAFVRRYADSPETQVQLLRNQQVLPQELPQPTPPPGLPPKRVEYLFHSIREYCTPQTQDVVCPAPAEVEDSDSTSEDGDEQSSSGSTSSDDIPPPKRRR